jgi:hypothetical protein
MYSFVTGTIRHPPIDHRVESWLINRDLISKKPLLNFFPKDSRFYPIPAIQMKVNMARFNGFNQTTNTSPNYEYEQSSSSSFTNPKEEIPFHIPKYSSYFGNLINDYLYNRGEKDENVLHIPATILTTKSTPSSKYNVVNPRKLHIELKSLKIFRGIEQHSTFHY